MANTLLNSNVITNRALMILHQKSNFLGSINRSYDDSFQNGGAAIGSTLRVRFPNQYSVRTGPTMQIQDVAESSVTLSVTSIKGVDAAFTDSDLALNIVDFSQQFLEPAMAVLAANVEADAFNMLTDVYNEVRTAGALTVRQVALARKALIDNLAPMDSNLMLRVNTQDNVDLIDNTKGLFNATEDLSKQYREGVFARGFGFDQIAENTFLTTFTRGAGNTAYTINGAGQTGATMVVQAGSGAVAVGDVFTLAGCNRVHPETKISTGVLQQFVATAIMASGGVSLAISPAIVTSGPTQNVSASPTNSGAITFAGTASTANGVSLAYHKNAFTFATADLVIPNNAEQAARKVQDGISMRYVRAWDQLNGRMTARFDILYGYKTLRPQLAVRLAAN